MTAVTLRSALQSALPLLAPLLYSSPQKLNPISNWMRPVLCLPCQMSTWFLIGLGAFKEPLPNARGEGERGNKGKGKFICSWEIIKITENGKSEIVRGYKDLPKTEVFTKYPAQVHKVYRCFLRPPPPPSLARRGIQSQSSGRAADLVSALPLPAATRSEWVLSAHCPWLVRQRGKAREWGRGRGRGRRDDGGVYVMYQRQ